MIEQISAFFTIEMIYLWVNVGVLPFWFILLFFPQSKICNFFVNRGKAKSADLESLIQQVKNKVLEKTGINLELELQIIGKNNE